MPGSEARSDSGGIPDLKWVNRHLPIRDVGAALGLRFGPGHMIHCWHPERHKAGDRTASVSIRKSTNRARCFGCGAPTLSVVDLVMDAQATDIAGAVLWLREHFDLKYIPKGRHLADLHAIRPYRVGHEEPIELLIKSGLWAKLNPPAQRIVPVLLCFAEPSDKPQTFMVRLSYRAIQRYSGVSSFGTIRKALQHLGDLEWLKTVSQQNTAARPLRDVNTYILTPYSDALMELANATAAATRATIEQERELRKQQRKIRRRALEASQRIAESSGTEDTERALLKSTSLYTECSVGQNGATRIVAGNAAPAFFLGLARPKVVRQRASACGHRRKGKRLAVRL